MTSSPSHPPDLVEQRLRATIDAIPRGRVASYGQVAAEAGLPGRARLVGRLLRELPDGGGLPWHRVLRSDGRLGLPRDTPAHAEQVSRLRSEGIEVDPRGRVNLARHLWRP